MLIFIILSLLMLLVLFYLNIVEFRWLKVDMGWCQKYGRGLRIFQKVIIEKSPKPALDFCV